GATHVCVAVADLQGRLDAVHEEQAAVSDGPEQILGRVDALFQHALTRTRLKGPICGLGIGLPGPVEFTSGRPVSPPLMPGWDDFPVGDYFTDKYDTPVWVDNEVNVMALGEFRAGIGQGIPDLIFVKVGHGIGAGLISQGRLHRGAQGCAGDIGHIGVLEESGVVCHCGNAGCLEALAGGAALERKGLAAALDGRSASLAETLRENGTVRAVDVRRAAQLGDSIALDLFNASATLVGEALAGIVNFFNPALIVLGGEVTNAGDMYLAAVRRAVLRRSLPLATRDLRIVRTQQPDRSGLTGAAFMVIDEVLSRDHLPVWLGKGKHPTDHSSSVRCVTGTA
ncbi:MAG: glcK2, partial [Burkholderia sp.]|nr:glcK2 [Burkholderia sp.]